MMNQNFLLFFDFSCLMNIPHCRKQLNAFFFIHSCEICHFEGLESNNSQKNLIQLGLQNQKKRKGKHNFFLGFVSRSTENTKKKQKHIICRKIFVTFCCLDCFLK